MAGYKPLRYTDVAEYLERTVKEGFMLDLTDITAADFITQTTCWSIKPEWIRVARENVRRNDAT